jgi:hypothetical protein
MKLINLLHENKRKTLTLDIVKDYLSKFSSMYDFRNDSKYAGIVSYIYKNYNADVWKEITKNLVKTTPRKKTLTLDIVKDYLSKFSSMYDFRNDSKYGGISTYIYRNYNADVWKELTKDLLKTSPGKKDDIVVTQKLIKQFPELDFSDVTYRFVDSRRFIDGVECHKTDENGEEHGISNNLSVKDIVRRGNGCRKCGKKRAKTDVNNWINSFPTESGLLFNPENFFYKTEGLKNKTLFVKDVICTKHTTPFVFAQNGVNIHNLRLGKTGCPICGKKESRGESNVINVLNELGYDVSKQKLFDGCFGYGGKRYCDKLKFDAYVIKNDGTEVCIEYDGIQHFEPVEFFGGEEGFKSLQERDAIKTNYCKENNIDLIRIPYWEEKNIKSILTSELGDNKLDECILRFKQIIHY